MNCHLVADFFLGRADADAGDLMSNLKLQKLAYYAQGLFLALYGQPLFYEVIEAWAHGPVVPELYHRFKHYGSNAITECPTIDPNDYTNEQLELLEDVYQVYGQFSAFKLRNMTHEEDPWKNTPQNGTISHEVLTQFFKSRLA